MAQMRLAEHPATNKNQPSNHDVYSFHLINWISRQKGAELKMKKKNWRKICVKGSGWNRLVAGFHQVRSGAHGVFLGACQKVESTERTADRGITRCNSCERNASSSPNLDLSKKLDYQSRNARRLMGPPPPGSHLHSPSVQIIPCIWIIVLYCFYWTTLFRFRILSVSTPLSSPPHKPADCL